MTTEAKGLAGEWYDSLPATAGIYRLFDEATGTSDNRVRVVIQLGNSGDPRAVGALCKLKSGRAVPVLRKLLGDRTEQPGIRRCAATALVAIKCSGAVAELRSWLAESGNDTDLRSFITDHMLRANIR